MRISNIIPVTSLGFLSILSVVFISGCSFHNSSISGKVIITAGGMQMINAKDISLNPDTISSGWVFLIEDYQLNKNAAEPEFVPDEVIVKYKPGVNQALMEKSVSGSGYFIAKCDNNGPGGDATLIKLTGSEKSAVSVNIIKERTLMAIDRLNSLALVEYAEPNYIYRVQFTPNDEYYSRQWHLPLTKIDRVWDDDSLTLLNDLSSVTVAVIDT